MKKKTLIFMFILFVFIVAGLSISFKCNKTYAAVGNTFKKMQAKHHMKRISMSKLYIIQPDLSQYNYKNSGVKAYEYTQNNVKYEAVFNYSGVCWLEFAVSNNSAVIPLSSLIKKNLYGYPILFKTIKYIPNVYEKLQYGKNIGKVIYIMQYIYQNNYILQEAVMPSMSPDGNYLN
ncbi:MAG: hypothetical protein ACYDDB_03840 [bacterium]